MATNSTTSRVQTDYYYAPIPEDLLYDSRLTAPDVRVYGCLMRHGLSSDDCFPSQTRIGELCHMSSRTVQRSIERLVECGWVRGDRRQRKDGGWTSNSYTVYTTPCDTSVVSPYDSGDPPPYDTSVALTKASKNESHKNETSPTSSSNSTRVGSGKVGFPEFWETFPRKDNRKRTLAAWREACTKEDPAVIVEAARLYGLLMERQHTAPDFIARSYNWLDGERWLDTDLEDAERSYFEGPKLSFTGPEMKFGS